MARTIETLELAGNALCLDFANSVNSRVHTVHDYLASYGDLLAWSAHAGSPAVTSRPSATVASAALKRAHRLREAIYQVFSAIAAGRKPPAADVEAVGAAYATAMAHATITRQPGGEFALRWPRADEDAPLWPVGHSAGDLLLNGPLDRIGECPGCGWLFLDTSRNGSRRWCNMAVCGSRDKMARFHHRARGG